MRSLFLFLLTLTVCWPSLAQTTQDQTNFMAQIMRERISFTNFSPNNSSALFAIKGPAGTLLGDPYLDSTWQAGNVKFLNRLGLTLRTDSLLGIPIRLDLLASEVELKAGDNSVKVIQATAVSYVDINNAFGSVSRFVPSQAYSSDGKFRHGFIGEVVLGKLSLLLHPSVYKLKSNYNVALNVGSKDDELVKQTDWYAASGKQAIKFSPGRKSILALMDDKKDQIAQFLKEKDPDLKSRQGLMSVFLYYNML